VKLKLDENLGNQPTKAFIDGGHDVKTVKGLQFCEGQEALYVYGRGWKPAVVGRA